MIDQWSKRLLRIQWSDGGNLDVSVTEHAGCERNCSTAGKYRRDNQQGGGLEAITKTKLKQMNFAATSWVEESKWTGDYQLAAVEIAGKNFSVMSFIDNVF